VRRVLVTGGSRGIGRAIAARFVAAGNEVVCPSRDELDLGDLASVERFIARDSHFDVLINNAGENKPLPLEEVGREQIERIITVNETAPYMLMRGIGLAMADRGWGRIVNVSSVYSIVSRARRTMYTTSKAALNGATTAFAVELGPRGVLVNAVLPGFVDTDLTRQNNSPSEIEALCKQVPLGRLASVEEIAEFVYFLASDANTYITGQSIPIDGGFLSA
jgi:3-oxoacyl-[acyl-carrier protein] reductase